MSSNANTMSSNMTTIPPVDMSAYYENQNQAAHILAACWLMTALATLVVAGRFYIRYKVIRRGGADDWWMLGGLSFLCALTGLITAIAQVGGFKHVQTLDAETLVHVRKLFWAAQPIGLIGSLLPKVSIGLQLLYIMPMSQRFRMQRYLVWTCLGISTIGNLLVFPMVFAQCNPADALWYTNGTCWNPEVNTIYFTVIALMNAVVDAIFVVIPVNIILGLQITFINKALLVNFLGARMFAFVAGVTKASYIAKNGFFVGDITWNAFDFLLWQCAEQFCLCFCGSFPTYKALFDRWLKRRASLKASQSSSYYYNSRPGTPQNEWFYEKKCFESPNEGGITKTIHIEVQTEHIDASVENLSSSMSPIGRSPTTKKKPSVDVVEASLSRKQSWEAGTELAMSPASYHGKKDLEF